MKLSLFRWGTALLASLAIAGCGGGGGGSAAVPAPTGTAVNTAITTASAILANDTATNPSASFTVLQGAGVPAVTINSPPKVNFAVFSDGAVKTGLALSNVRFAIAKLVPGANGNPDEWVSYISTTKTAVSGVGPGGLATPKATAKQATTDGTMSLEEVAAAELVGQLTYNPDGYYTYAFKTDITDLTKTGGVTYEPALTHRIAIQLSYKNAAGATVLVNPYYDFTIVDGKSVPVSASQTRKMTDVASCNSCHEKLALHGGGRVDTQYCVMCHNPGTTDPESGNVLTLSTMAHSIHAGRRIKATTGGDYTIWGYAPNGQPPSKHDYAEVGFPQDLRNCSKCHSASNPATPQGDNWKTAVSKQACLTCHTSKTVVEATASLTASYGDVTKVPASVLANAGSWDKTHVVYAKDAGVVGATAAATNTRGTDLTNAQCVACHKVGSSIAPETVHWNQNEENSAKYKMNIETATYDATARKVTVKYFLSDPTSGNVAYDLITSDCTYTGTPGACVPPGTRPTIKAEFGNLMFYLAYQNMKGQSTAVTEFSAYNNGGNNVSAYAHAGTNDGNNHYTVVISLPADTATAVAAGTARLVSIGQIKEAELKLKSNKVPREYVNAADPRASLVNVVVQHTYKDVVLSGALQPRREVVSNDKCNACHGALGTTSGSNTLASAFHSGARNTVEACVICHDANRGSSGNMMTNGLALYESYQFKRMIHGIHGNSKRVNPFTHGNKVVGNFSKAGALTTAGVVFDDQYTNANPKVRFIVAGDALVGGTPLAAGTTFQTIADLMNSAALAAGYLSTNGSTFTSAAENYAAEVAYPGVGLNCNACHVKNSYKSDPGTLGTVVMKGVATAATASAPAVMEADPANWFVISPKAASCTGCHDSPTAMGHVTAFGGSAFGNKTQGAVSGLTGSTALPSETCNDCHAPGGFKGVDIVHGQQ